MGSLMAGWNSPVSDPKSATYQRNQSFTKGAIDSFWRSKKRIEEEHLRAISGSSESSQNIHPETGGKLQRSSSLPVPNRRGDWWTMSNWAFLNEPPVIPTEGPTYKYASQYHIYGSSKPDTRDGIST